MVGPDKVPFRVAYGNMYPFQGLPGRTFVGLFAYMYVDIVGDIDVRRAFVGKDDGLLVINRLLERTVGALHFMVGQDLGLEISTLPLYLSRIDVLKDGTLRHDHDIGLGLAATPFFLCRMVLGGGLYREISLVRLDHALQSVAVVPLPHGLAQFVYHCPYGLITFRPQLALDFLAGEPFLGGAQQEYGLVPGHEGQLGTLHYGAAAQRYPCLARSALVAPLVLQPIVVRALAPMAYHALLVALGLEMQATTFFVREVYSERKYIHFSTTFGSVKYTDYSTNLGVFTDIQILLLIYSQ